MRRSPAVGTAAVALVAGLAAACTPVSPVGDSRLPQAASWSSVAGGTDNSGLARHDLPHDPVLRWSRPLGAPLTGVATSAANGILFQATVSENGCNLFALSADDGRKTWCLRLPTEGPRITATVDGRDGTFVPLRGGAAGLSDDGELRWNTPLSGTPTTLALVDERTLLVIDQFGGAVLLNSHTGQPTSAIAPLAGPVDPAPPEYGIPWCGIGERGCPAPGPAALDTASRTFYLTVWRPTADHPDLVAVSVGDAGLTEKWRAPLPGGRLGTPAVLGDSGHTVYLHSGDGSLIAVSSADGSVRWTTPIGYRPDVAPALLPDGTIVTGGRSSTVWRGPDAGHTAQSGPAPVVAIRPDGGIAWRRDDLEQLANPVASPDGLVAVATRNDQGSVVLNILDGTRDGRTVGQTLVPAAEGPVSGLSADAEGRIAASTAMGAVYLYS